MAPRKTRATVLCVIPALVCAGISVEPSCNTGPDGNDAACAQRSGQSVLQKKSDVREQSSSATETEEETSSEGGRTPWWRRFWFWDKDPSHHTPCRDHNRKCTGWGQLGYCAKTYVDFMKKNCPQTCRWCPPTVREDCADAQTSCNDWAELGYCHKDYVDYMKKHCMKACGYCKPPASQLEMEEQPQDMNALANPAVLSHEGLPEPEPQMEEPQEDEGMKAFENPAGLLQEGLPEPEPPMEQPKEDDDMKAFEHPTGLS